MTPVYPLARGSWTRPAVPADYDPKWYSIQLANIARSAPGAGRLVTFGSADSDKTLKGPDDLTVLVFDATDGAIDFTLLPAEQWPFGKCWLLQRDSSGNDVTLRGVVSGSTNPTLGGQYHGLVLFSDGVSYYSLGSF